MDWELRTPITPPMTFHEEAKVILIAGTSHFGSSGFVWRETLTELVSETFTHKLRDISSVE